MSYGLEIYNADEKLVISSESSVILNKQTIPTVNFTVQSGATENISVEDAGDTNQIALSISPTASVNGANISVSLSGDTLSVTNANGYPANFDLFVFRIG